MRKVEIDENILLLKSTLTTKRKNLFFPNTTKCKNGFNIYHIFIVTNNEIININSPFSLISFKQFSKRCQESFLGYQLENFKKKRNSLKEKINKSFKTKVKKSVGTCNIDNKNINLSLMANVDKVDIPLAEVKKVDVSLNKLSLLSSQSLNIDYCSSAKTGMNSQYDTTNKKTANKILLSLMFPCYTEKGNNPSNFFNEKAFILINNDNENKIIKELPFLYPMSPNANYRSSGINPQYYYSNRNEILSQSISYLNSFSTLVTTKTSNEILIPPVFPNTDNSSTSDITEIDYSSVLILIIEQSHHLILQYQISGTDNNFNKSNIGLDHKSIELDIFYKLLEYHINNILLMELKVLEQWKRYFLSNQQYNEITPSLLINSLILPYFSEYNSFFEKKFN
ncbi:hypothetical protein BCR32DRAFT_282953 [Anaeromyces robustus]|uniref:Uncharacterized protein n=1 Tax=Anaeromyces robustus TaxID=1754192 RepID=A0A1Y1WVV4_9FUNG|nr:hypothetical protein BCR32DRAFT_282953 [Anaeromyces robustus]|eukprot:ORX77689.1 hypothetical protein BCR32DRAFT_282953 [Anaeromyces robustus]